MPKTHVTDHVAVVTGGSSGIGREVVRQLAWRGVRILTVSREEGDGAEAALGVREETGNQHVEFFPADLSSMEEVRRTVEAVRDRFDAVHLLFNNAGAYFGSRRLTEDGYEMTFAVNHLAHFALALGLKAQLVAGGRSDAPSRVVTTSSDAARGRELTWDDLMLENGYRGWRAYGRSKLANQMFALELAERWARYPVASHAFHPGLVNTAIGPESGISRWAWQEIKELFGRSVREGAETALHVLCHPEAGNRSGLFWRDCEPREPAEQARDAEARDRLWTRSIELTGASDL